MLLKFYVLLIVHPGFILVNSQLDANFFMYVYFYSLRVSGSHVSIIRRITVSIYLVYITLCRWPSGMQEHMLLHTRRSSTQSDINQVSEFFLILQFCEFCPAIFRCAMPPALVPAARVTTHGVTFETWPRDRPKSYQITLCHTAIYRTK